MVSPAADACQFAAAGLATGFACAMGFSPWLLGPVLLAAVVGAVNAPPTGRLHGLAIFIAVVALSCLAGTALSDRFNEGALRYAQIWGSFIAVLFHPLLQALASALPDKVRSLLKVENRSKT